MRKVTVKMTDGDVTRTLNFDKLPDATEMTDASYKSFATGLRQLFTGRTLKSASVMEYTTRDIAID